MIAAIWCIAPTCMARSTPRNTWPAVPDSRGWLTGSWQPRCARWLWIPPGAGHPERRVGRVSSSVDSPEAMKADASPDGLAVALLRDAVDHLGGTHRSGQEDMAREVAQAMEDGVHLLVQAGTGTGKSLGYLLPA